MALNMNKILIYRAPFLNLKIRWVKRNNMSSMLGKRAGKILIESKILPFSNSMNALCVPHPGHSVPRNFT